MSLFSCLCRSFRSDIFSSAYLQKTFPMAFSCLALAAICNCHSYQCPNVVFHLG